MGSSNFSEMFNFTDRTGAISAEEAYRQLCAERSHEYGYSSYNGTISTTSGVQVRHSSPVTLQEAMRIESERLDSMSKWEECEAVALVEETEAEYGPVKRHRLVVECTLQEARDEDALRKIAARQLLTKTDRIGQVWCQILKNVSVKVDATATKGATQTRYFVLVNGIANFKWDNGYASQAEARANLEQHVPLGDPDVSLEIVSMTRRVGGEALVTATATPRKVQIRLNVDERDVVKKAMVGTKHAGWYFYGWAAS